MEEVSIEDRETAVKASQDWATTDPADIPRPALLAIDEALGGSERTEFAPAGDAGELATAASGLQEVAAYSVPSDRAALLEEVSVAVAADGSGMITMSGQQFGPFTGAVDVSLPFGGAILGPGETVRVLGESSAGVATSIAGTIVVREV